MEGLTEIFVVELRPKLFVRRSETPELTWLEVKAAISGLEGKSRVDFERLLRYQTPQGWFEEYFALGEIA